MIDDIPDPRLGGAYAHCQRLLRDGDRDRWLASLFAPATLRPHLHAIYAFNLDVARVPEIVSDPMPGEIRFQWWRDTLESEGRGDVGAHPVAAALLHTVRQCLLPVSALTNLVDARTFDLYQDPMPGLRQFEGYCGETSSALLRLSSLALASGQDPGQREPGGADAAGHGGVAYAIAGLLRALPWHAARGQCYMPRDVLTRHGSSTDEVLARRATPALMAALKDLRDIARKHLALARADLKNVSSAASPAFLPLALVDPYLRRMDERNYDPFRSNTDLPPFSRHWALWRAARG